MASASGKMPFVRDGKETEIEFIANCTVSKKRKLCTLSNVWGDTLGEQEIEILVSESEDADEEVFVVEKEERPEIRRRYSQLMDFVDRVDQIVSSALGPNRKYQWSQSLLTWIMTALTMVNALKLYQSATGNFIDVPTWKKKVVSLWGGAIDPETNKHPLATIPLPVRAKCASCSRVLPTRKRACDTSMRCPLCGPICKHCDGTCQQPNCSICAELYNGLNAKNGSRHLHLYHSSSSTLRRNYSRLTSSSEIRKRKPSSSSPNHPVTCPPLPPPSPHQRVTLPSCFELMAGVPVNTRIDGPINDVEVSGRPL